MLHAIYHNKGSLWRRYIGHRDERDGNVYAEDEITSAFLGTQNFLGVNDVWRIWEVIIGKDLYPSNIKFSPERFEIKLWPRIQIEPDALITFFWPNNVKILLLIEFKWNAKLSSPNQLEKQWKEFLTKDERENAWHLFISKDISAAVPYIDKWRIIPITWLQVKSALKKVSPKKETMSNGNLVKYCNLMVKFMDKIQIRTFGGFNHLTDIPVLPNAIKEFIFFKSNKG